MSQGTSECLVEMMLEKGPEVVSKEFALNDMESPFLILIGDEGPGEGIKAMLELYADRLGECEQKLIDLMVKDSTSVGAVLPCASSLQSVETRSLINAADWSKVVLGESKSRFVPGLTATAGCCWIATCRKGCFNDGMAFAPLSMIGGFLTVLNPARCHIILLKFSAFTDPSVLDLLRGGDPRSIFKNDIRSIKVTKGVCLWIPPGWSWTAFVEPVGDTHGVFAWQPFINKHLSAELLGEQQSLALYKFAKTTMEESLKGGFYNRGEAFLKL